MRKTETYQLNQWDPADRIMMEDFNRDNARIEAAIAAVKAEAAADRAAWKAAMEAERAARQAAVEAERSAREEAAAALAGRSSMELLRTMEVTEAAGSVTLSLADLDWSRWREVRISFKVLMEHSENVKAAMPYGAGTFGTIRAALPTSTWSPDGQGEIFLFPLYDPQRAMVYLFHSTYDTGVHRSGQVYSACTSVIFSHETEPLLPGTNFQLWAGR